MITVSESYIDMLDSIDPPKYITVATFKTLELFKQWANTQFDSWYLYPVRDQICMDATRKQYRAAFEDQGPTLSSTWKLSIAGVEPYTIKTTYIIKMT